MTERIASRPRKLEVLAFEFSTWVSGVKSGVDGEQSCALHPGGPWCAAYLILGDLAHKELRMFRNARERTRAGSRVSVTRSQ
jgi:hypothetical protein